MYIPADFKEERIETLHALIRAQPLATLVTLGADGLIASHVPLEIDPDPAPFGTLRGHLARGNPQWRDAKLDTEALAIFQGPAAYVSPSWYATKRESGKVVPTWNYAVVHARGRLAIHDDPVWLGALVRRLTESQERRFAESWKVEDAPADFIDRQLKAIVGIEMRLARLDGKWKMSQNRPAADREGVVGGLEALGDEESRAVAALVRDTLDQAKG
jgi:transcriptional regulator